MATLKIKDINAKLIKKGFTQKNNDHHFFYYINNGKKTGISTKTSFGSKKEIGDPLISAMAKQVRLEKPDFLRLIKCTLSKLGYRELLIKNGDLK